MLQAIHDKAKGWIAYAIVGFISVPFALWGINSYMEGGTTLAAAVVNGEDVPAREVQQQLTQMRQQFGQMAASMGDDGIKQMALDGAISQVLLRQKAEEVGYRASPAAVAETIAGVEAFQKDGKFDQATYESLLKMQRRSPAEFENSVRDDLTQGQFRQGVMDTAFAPKAQLELYQSLRNQKRDIELFTLKVADFEGQVQIADDQVKRYYEENKSRFMTEEKVKLAYLELNLDALANGVTLDEAALQAFYDENADRYAAAESRNVSHILVLVDDPAKDADAKKRVDALYADIQAGKKTFEDAAKVDSDDKAAATNAGVVGDVTAGSWDPEFEKVVFTLETNKVSEPVKTGAGYEIIRVNGVTAAFQKPFADVKAQVETDARRAQAEKLFADQAEKIQTLVYEQSGDLAPAAKAIGAAVAETAWVTRAKGDGDGVMAHPKVLEAAFSDDVLKERKNSELIPVSETQAVAMRVVAHEPPAQKPLDEVKADIVVLLKAQEARKLVAQKGEELLKQVASTGWVALDTSGLGKAETVEKPGMIPRVGGTLAPQVTEKAFAISRPAQGALSWDSVVLPNGDYAVLALKAVEDGAKVVEEGAGQVYNGSLGSRELGAALQDLRDRAEVELHPENI